MSALNDKRTSPRCTRKPKARQLESQTDRHQMLILQIKCVD